MDLLSSDSKERQKKIKEVIEYFKYEYYQNNSGHLECVFCKTEFLDFSNEMVKNHVTNSTHNLNRVQYLLKQQFKSVFKNCKVEMNGKTFDDITDTLLNFETTNNKRVEEIDKETLEGHILKRLKTFSESNAPVIGKIKKVKLAFENKMFCDLPSDTVKCTKCQLVISDSLTKMTEHLENCFPDFINSLPVINWTPKNLIIEKVNREKYLLISEKPDTVKCKVCKIELQSIHATLTKHLISANHLECCRIYEKKKETDFLINSNEFQNWLNLVLSSCDISFAKIKGLKNFLETFTGRKILCETTFRTRLSINFKLIEQNVRNEIGDNDVYISMDEATAKIVNTKFVSVIVGTLIPDNPTLQKSFLFSYVKLETAWTKNEVFNVFINTLKQLYGDNWFEISQNKLKLMVADAGSQMVSGSKLIKQTFPKMVFFTCLCHSLHNLCETILQKFKNAMEFVTAMNNILFSSSQKLQDFKNRFNLKSPIKAIPTRWGTGLNACKYWFDNYNEAVEFLKSLEKDTSQWILKAKNLVQSNLAKAELEIITNNYCFISSIIYKLETRNQALETSIQLVEFVKTELNKNANSPTGKEIVNRFSEILNRNPGFTELVSNIATNPDYAPLKFAPIGSYESERGNKIYKSTLTSDRVGMIPENIKMWSYIRFNSLTLGMRDIKVKNVENGNSLQVQNAKELSFSSLFIKSENKTEKEIEISELNEYILSEEIYEELDYDLENSDSLFD